MPLSAVRRHYGVAVRTRRCGVLFISGAHAGARRSCRRRGAGGPATDADTPFDGALRGRTFRGRGAQEAGAHDRRLPDLATAAVFRRRGGGGGCAVRAALCPLPRDLLSATSIISAIRSSAPGPAGTACSRSASIATMRCFPSIIGCSRASTCCASISLFRASFSAAASPASMRSLPRIKARTVDIVFRLRRTECTARGRGSAADLRALCGTSHQSVREDRRSHPAEVEPARISRRPRSQPLPGLRAASRAGGVCALCRRTGKGPGATALFGVARRFANCVRHSLFSPPPAAAAHRRREARRRLVGLHRHGHVHFARANSAES